MMPKLVVFFHGGIAVAAVVEVYADANRTYGEQVTPEVRNKVEKLINACRINSNRPLVEIDWDSDDIKCAFALDNMIAFPTEV